MFDYKTYTSRNSGYIPHDIQEKIRTTTLLIAGCGIGSSIATCAARMGFSNFVLVDGDTIEAHNLNRQFFDYDDIGHLKTDALEKNIKRINPNIYVESHPFYLTQDNVVSLVERCDFVIDSIDFLDLEAVCALHAAAKSLSKPVISSLNMGWGSGCLYFPSDGKVQFTDFLDNSTSYVDAFARLMNVLGPQLDPEVLHNIQSTMHVMEDGKPCPASQLSAGTFSVGSLVCTLLFQILSGENVKTAPHMIVNSFKDDIAKRSISLVG